MTNGYQFDTYHSFENLTSSLGLYLRAATGLSDDVRISERLNLPRKDCVALRLVELVQLMQTTMLAEIMLLHLTFKQIYLFYSQFSKCRF